jgi:hypothetical protein
VALFGMTGCSEKNIMQDQEKIYHMTNQSKIITADKIEDIEIELGKADEKTLVVFDCDDVLTTIRPHFWERSNKEAFLELHEKEFPNASRYLLLEHLSQIVASYDAILVNEKMPQLVDDLQQKGIKTIVLTAFSTKASHNFPNPMKWRIDKLQSLGYHFERSFPSLPNSYLPMPNDQPIGEYSQGIICCGGARKDDSLEAFLLQAGLQPSKIIFIDDSIENVRHIEAFCKKHKIDFVGIEYIESDITKGTTSPFPTKRIEFQLKKFHENGLWICDEEAEKEMAR